jgi:AcrR family transcriptional regulator
MRRDAEQNRERLIAAAEAVFGSQGPSGTTEEVARLAGVGIATVFRHFPTKEALVEAALVAHFDRLTARANSLRQDADPGQALASLVRAMVSEASTKVTLASAASGEVQLTGGARAASDQLRQALAAALRRAQDSGAVGDSVTVNELYLLIRALAQASATASPDKKTLNQAVEIVLSGLLTR